MAVTVLYRLAGEPEVTGETAFTDVNEEAYYYRGAAVGLSGCRLPRASPRQFAPNGSVTREQAVTFLYRYVVNYLRGARKRQRPVRFPDADEISTLCQRSHGLGRS